MDSHPVSHAMEALEFPAVLELIANLCVNDDARVLVRSLEPSTLPDAVTDALVLCQELREHLDQCGDVPIADTGYACAIEEAVQHNRIPSGEAFLRIASGEQTVGEIASAFASEAEERPRLAELVRNVAPNTELVNQVHRALDSDGNVKDSASPELGRIRKQILRAREDMRNESERQARKMGKDAYATVLGSRTVLLIPRTHFRKHQGVVHSTSQSGESYYFEPFSLLEKNNESERLVLEENAEVTRILQALTALVQQSAEALLSHVALLNRIDAVRAQAGFARDFDCSAPALSRSGDIRLRRARHPLLQAQLRREDREESLVPLELELNTGERVMVITGPNAGGKTVSLKTLGVAQLLFQCGVPVPCAEGSHLPVFDKFYVDIGDEQSIETSLSSFTSHLGHLDRMCRGSDEGTLCLVDEIGDGTDPDEGAALAMAALERLLESGAAVIATTHYGRIKMFALQTGGVSNASMAFADDELVPLYQLVRGVAGRSRGIETARRTGFDEAVVRRAESFLGAEASRVEELLGELEAAHLALEREREKLEYRSRSLEAEVSRYSEMEQEYGATKKDAMLKARREAAELLSGARSEIERLVKEIREGQAGRAAIRDTQQRLRDLAQVIGESPPAPPEAVRATELAPGDRITLRPTGGEVGTVLDVENGSATVEINGKRIKLRVDALYLARNEASTPPGGLPGESAAGRSEGIVYDVDVEPLTSSTLDVRGHDREEALEAVHRFIDRAMLSGVIEVRIIHGIGEGILLRAIHTTLGEDRRVDSFRAGQVGEGGVGVTYVTLA